jgi:hypothetical protein
MVAKVGCTEETIGAAVYAIVEAGFLRFFNKVAAGTSMEAGFDRAVVARSGKLRRAREPLIFRAARS